MNYTIRPAGTDDLPDLVAMMHALAVEEGSQSELTVATLQEAAERGQPSLIMFLAVTQDTPPVPAGGLIAYAGFDVLSATIGSHLSDIYIRPDQRGQGIGTALFHALSRHTLEEGGAWVSWTVMRQNEAARGFYRHLGACDVNVQFMAMGATAMRQLCQRRERVADTSAKNCD
jgi:ribosomal protein S18 acetylase RimI-like enzyme